MTTTFVCLANSFKEGGRCIAGIELEGFDPILIEGKPKWLRPIFEAGHGEVPSHIVSLIALLDVVEIDITKEVPDKFQSENILFTATSIKVVGKFPLSKLLNLCETTSSNIFGNRGKAISEESVTSLKNSLMLINVDDNSIYEKVYSENPSKPQVRIIFQYKSTSYDLPITDPIFLDKYKLNKNILNNSNLYLTLSLAVLHDGWHYKLVAGIIQY